jgi:Fe-S cluster biogenesis protein NfuA
MGIRKILQNLRASEASGGGPSAGHVHVHSTPNPDARKFSVDRPVIEGGSATYRRPAPPEAPSLVRDLLEVPGVRGLFFLDTFCTVTIESGAPWDDVTLDVAQRLRRFVVEGEVPLVPPRVDPSELGAVERRIHELLEGVIRPAVQRDGGDIAFAGYEDGRVQLYMHGSCVGCPSSRVTLKMGVENLLREEIPEIREVVALD